MNPIPLLRTLVLTASFLVGITPSLAEGPSPRAALLDIVEAMPNASTSMQALRPLVEKAKTSQLGDFDRGLYFEAIGDNATARKHFERAVAALDPNKPGKDAWCVAYRLLRIPDEKVDRASPAVREKLSLQRHLNIPLVPGDLEKTATTERIRTLWNELPEPAQAETGPLPRKLTLIQRAVALAGRWYAQDDTPALQPFNASARCWLRGANLKPLYPEAAKLGLVDFQMNLANDLAQSANPESWQEAVKWYQKVAQHAAPPLSVVATTGAARVSERLLQEGTAAPMAWKDIFAAYRAGSDAGHETSKVLYADALQRGLGGLEPDEAAAVRLYKSVLDQTGDKTYGNALTSFLYMVHAQSQLTALWRAGKIAFDAQEQKRYLTPAALMEAEKKP